MSYQFFFSSDKATKWTLPPQVQLGPGARQGEGREEHPDQPGHRRGVPRVPQRQVDSKHLGAAANNN